MYVICTPIFHLGYLLICNPKEGKIMQSKGKQRSYECPIGSCVYSWAVVLVKGD